MDCLNNSTIFSKINLKATYHRIQIHKGDEWKTAFRIQYGYYEYLIVSFELTNISATFQAFINQALRGLVDDFYMIYLNNILIFSRTEEEHQVHLELVIEHLHQMKLYANSKKCKFFKIKLEYLGFIIDKNGLWMDPAYIQMILKWRNHSSRIYCDVQVFLGFCNFYWHFIYNFSDIARSLYYLLAGMKNSKKPGLIADTNKWQKPQQEAFKRLSNVFISTPVLCHYDLNHKL